MSGLAWKSFHGSEVVLRRDLPRRVGSSSTVKARSFAENILRVGWQGIESRSRRRWLVGLERF